jgi:hypothetical protein
MKRDNAIIVCFAAFMAISAFSGCVRGSPHDPSNNRLALWVVLHGVSGVFCATFYSSLLAGLLTSWVSPVLTGGNRFDK